MQTSAPLAVLRQQYGPAGHDQEGRVVAKPSSSIWLQYLSSHLQQRATLVLSRLDVWLKCDVLSTLAEHACALVVEGACQHPTPALPPPPPPPSPLPLGPSPLPPPVDDSSCSIAACSASNLACRRTGQHQHRMHHRYSVTTSAFTCPDGCHRRTCSSNRRAQDLRRCTAALIMQDV